MQNYNVLSLFKDNEHLLPQHFINTDLGKLYLAIPFDELAKNIPPPKGISNGLGRKNQLNVKGGLALMFLKHYLRLSDEMLLARLNTDWSIQMFCGILLGTKRILNKNLVSQWRSYLGRHMDLNQMQGILASYWKPYLQDRQVGMSDATVYESYIRHPNEVVLLWKGCEFIYEHIVKHCKENKIRTPRIRMQNKQEQVLTYQRTRKKSRKRARRMRIRLTKFLSKLIKRYDELEVIAQDAKRLKTIRTLLYQQEQRIKHPDKKIPHRIVSLHKPYVRPIVRGKEVKSVEFGAKVNLLQVDGINFVEHLSFENFNEGIRLPQAIRKHRELFGACHQFAADKIYATNKNRRYCKKQNIATNFVPKGKQAGKYLEQAQQLRKELGKQRATVLEGSFGNEKNHYLLQKVKARNQANEIVWIFFGIMTCNAVQMSRRMEQAVYKRKAA
jgi:transposase, IS5 family